MRQDEISRRSLLLGIGVCAVLLSIGVAASVYFAQHHESTTISPDAAAAEIQKIRERFAGQKPLVDMNAPHAGAVEAGACAQRIQSFHTVIFDTRGGPRLVRL